MGSFPGILFPSSFNYLISEKPFVLLIFPTSLSFRLGTVIHTLLSSHLSNLRIDVVASKGDFVVTFEQKTLILWDMNAGVQKATFNADKVGASLLRRGLLFCPREVGERENWKCAGVDGKGKERKFSPPIVHRALAFFKIIVSFNAIPRGSLPEERW